MQTVESEWRQMGKAQRAAETARAGAATRSLLVVDIESTCWEHAHVQRTSVRGAAHRGCTPPQRQSEIIQVGVAKLTLYPGWQSKVGIAPLPTLWIRPTESDVSEFCTSLTGITPDRAAQGGAFAEACRVLRHDYGAKDMPWASWGDYDRNMFRTQCDRRRVTYPFSEVHCNLKQLVYRLTGKRMGMDRALADCGLELVGRHHDGGDDAYNIARIASHILTAGLVDEADFRQSLGLA